MRVDPNLFVLRYDARGLPVLEWREGEPVIKPVHRCFIDFDVASTGEPLFSAMRQDPGGQLFNRWRRLLGVWLGGSVGCAALLNVAGAMPRIQSGFEWLAGSLLLGGLLSFVGVLVPFVGWSAWKLRQTVDRGGHVTETSAFGPWSELQNFEVKATGDQGKAMYANFSNWRPFAVSTERWDGPTMAEFHALLTREFIEQRAEHLERLAAERRSAQDLTVAPRQKVI